MAVYGPVRHQKNITWTSEDSVRILPYDLQCHELFSIYSYVGFKRSLELVLFRRTIEISLYITNFHNKGIMSLICLFSIVQIFFTGKLTLIIEFSSQKYILSLLFLWTHIWNINSCQYDYICSDSYDFKWPVDPFNIFKLFLLLRMREVCCLLRGGRGVCRWKTCTRSYDNFNRFC